VRKTLDVRKHVCAACGYTADRDTNAARNILALGQEVLRQEEADRPRMEAARKRKEARALRMELAGLDASADTGEPDDGETDDGDGDLMDVSVPMRLTA
jgi:hypothetical protein